VAFIPQAKTERALLGPAAGAGTDDPERIVVDPLADWARSGVVASLGEHTAEVLGELGINSARR
jgi:hypothetical protein